MKWIYLFSIGKVVMYFKGNSKGLCFSSPNPESLEVWEAEMGRGVAIIGGYLGKSLTKIQPENPGECRQSFGSSGRGGWRGPGALNWAVMLGRCYCITTRPSTMVVICKTSTLQVTNISHLRKRNIIFKSALVGDVLVPSRVSYS